jgi:hypothetical protein
MRSSNLTTCMMLGISLGVVVKAVGHNQSASPATAKEVASYFNPLTDIFLRLIKMIISPLVFVRLVSGTASMNDGKMAGGVGNKAFAWFVTASMISLRRTALMCISARYLVYIQTCLAILVVATSSASAQSDTPSAYAKIDASAARQRVLVLTDIGNEPDDQMSLVRLLVYANALDIEGLVATTSVWQSEHTHAETIVALVEAYGEVRPNLMKHADGWPEATSLKAIIAAGPAGYGMAAIRPAALSSGARRLIDAADKSDSRPLWISVWGGANTLAEALRSVRANRSSAALAAFVDKLRIYSISDQDDAGPWIRREFPNLFYIVQPSTPGSADYAQATWTGISGDRYYRNGEGADFSTVGDDWLETNIRAKGTLGRHYPRYMFIMEGDTPAFLNLLPSGLESYRNPSWGGWGGRYIYRQPYGETRPIWSQGGDLFSRVSSADTVIGIDGNPHTSDQATVWRWRQAFQHDFAARMDWTYKSYEQANHHPLAQVNGQGGLATLEIQVQVGQSFELNAEGSIDPDGNQLNYRWFQYDEAGGPPDDARGVGQAELAIVADGISAKVHAKATCRPRWLGKVPCSARGIGHVILAVTDNGQPSLTTYRRIIVRVLDPTAPATVRMPSLKDMTKLMPINSPNATVH